MSSEVHGDDVSLAKLYFVSQLIITTLFLILLIFEIQVVFKIGLSRFDKPSKIILLSYTLCICTKMISVTIYNA